MQKVLSAYRGIFIWSEWYKSPLQFPSEKFIALKGISFGYFSLHTPAECIQCSANRFWKERIVRFWPECAGFRRKWRRILSGHLDTGIFRYIRHPLYSSLIFLTWGIFLKNETADLLIVALISTLFLYLTAIFDEKECVRFFGEKYVEYKKRSKMFIPFII